MNARANLSAQIKMLVREIRDDHDDATVEKRFEAFADAIVALFDGATEEILNAAQQRAAIQIRGAVSAAMVGGLVAIGSAPPRLADYPSDELVAELRRRTHSSPAKSKE